MLDAAPEATAAQLRALPEGHYRQVVSHG